MAHRGWARLLLNRARDLIIHDPAHRGAYGAAMPTDEDDQDGHFFFNHPERGNYHLKTGLSTDPVCLQEPKKINYTPRTISVRPISSGKVDLRTRLSGGIALF